jgi:hypothetical protein
MALPLFIIARDRVTQLKRTVESLERTPGIDIIIVDNASTHPPTVEYLEKSPHKVIRADANYGQHAPWRLNLLPETGPFLLTDPDIALVPECPADWLVQLEAALKRHSNYVKAGVSLRIDNIPDCYFLSGHVRNWESQFWQNVLEERDDGLKLYDALIDTTLALYRNKDHNILNWSIRLGWPYTAEHIPWYVDSNNLTEEEVYYRAHCDKNIASWRYSEEH